MKALVTGAAGQIGQALLQAAPAHVELAALTRSELDISDAAAVRSAASRSTSPIATRMPRRRNAAAVARPMPRAAPVIAAVWPARMRDCLAMISS